MSLQRIHLYRSADEMATSMAGRLISRIVELQQTKDHVHLALTGGVTPLKVYESLANLAQASELDLSRLELWWTDEGYVSTTDHLRNSTSALTLLAGALPFVSAQVHPMPSSTGTGDSDEAAYAYSKELGEVVFDICLLNVGADGHVAAVYPDNVRTAPQIENSLSVIGVTDAPTDPPERITLTLRRINTSDEVWLLAAGQAKAEAVARGIQHDALIPAGIVQGAHRTDWFIDQDAGSRLPRYRCRF